MRLKKRLQTYLLATSSLTIHHPHHRHKKRRKAFGRHPNQLASSLTRRQPKTPKSLPTRQESSPTLPKTARKRQHRRMTSGRCLQKAPSVRRLSKTKVMSDLSLPKSPLMILKSARNQRYKTNKNRSLKFPIKNLRLPQLM